MKKSVKTINSNRIVLSTNGYRLNKEKFTKEQIDEIKEELTVKPISFNDADIEPYAIYRETPSELIIPRHYGVGKLGKHDIDTFKHATTKMQFLKNLRDYQEDICVKCVRYLQNHNGGILSVPCGRGKTVMALKLACILGLKTLVVVHKSFLQDQWVARINQFTDAKVGIIRQDKIKVANVDIVVGMLQSIAMKDYDPKIFDDFGCVIYDECHHTASKIYVNALYKTCGKYTIGLSATPKRADGLTKVINWYIGNMMYSEKQQKNLQVVAKILYYKSNHPNFKEYKKWYLKTRKSLPDTVKMITNLCDSDERNMHLVNIINELRKNPERKILVLSERKQHLTDLKTFVDSSIQKDIENGIILPNECISCFYTGDCTREERNMAEEDGDILFATTGLANEGLDIERLNTIILATPMRKITQAIGRIMRKILKTGDIRPLIIDFSDKLSSFVSQSNDREKEYINTDYKIEHYYIRNANLVTFDAYMLEEGYLDQEDIDAIPDKPNYIPQWSNVLNIDNVQNIANDE